MAYWQPKKYKKKIKQKLIALERVESTEVSDIAYLQYEYMLHNPTEAEAEAAWVETRVRLQQALSRLTPRQLQVLIMKEVDGKKEINIAKSLSISQAAVSQHYHRALKKLRKIW